MYDTNGEHVLWTNWKNSEEGAVPKAHLACAYRMDDAEYWIDREVAKFANWYDYHKSDGGRNWVTVKNQNCMYVANKFFKATKLT